MKRVQQNEIVFDSDHLAKIFKNNFMGQILAIGQVNTHLDNCSDFLFCLAHCHGLFRVHFVDKSFWLGTIGS